MPPEKHHPYFSLSHLAGSQLGVQHGAYPAQIRGERAPETKALNVTFPDKEGRAVSIAAWNAPLFSVTGETPTLNLSGPIIGICEFGVGGMSQRFEFNLPLPFVDNNNNGSGTRRDFSTNGVQFNLTCSALTLAFRNDCNSLAALDDVTGNTAFSIGEAVYQTQPVPPGVFNAAPTMSSVPQPAIVGASVALNSVYKPLAPLERTYAIVNRLGTSMPVSPAANSSITIAVPQFAKRVRIYHGGGLGLPTPPTIITVRLRSAFLSRMFPINLAPLGDGVYGPIDLPTYCSDIEIINTGANPIFSMFAAFELSL